MNKVFAIYPLDKSCSTSFLNRIHTFETRKLGEFWHCYKVHFTDEDHENCLNASRQSNFVIFMGHGGEAKLHGACGKNGEMTVDYVAASENHVFYNKDVFIDTFIIQQFKGQIFFCFSCNSNRWSSKSLSRSAIVNGVEAFVGFGDIPTDFDSDINFPKRCIAVYKGKIVKIIKFSIYFAVENNETVDGLVRIIELLTTKEIQKLKLQRNFHGRNAVIAQLYEFKNGIRVFGNRYARINK